MTTRRLHIAHHAHMAYPDWVWATIGGNPIVPAHQSLQDTLYSADPGTHTLALLKLALLVKPIMNCALWYRVGVCSHLANGAAWAGSFDAWHLRQAVRMHTNEPEKLYWTIEGVDE